jgi:transcriptional regulator with XRE-family HTH domain
MQGNDSAVNFTGQEGAPALLGARLRAQREALGMSQAVFSAQCGVSRRALINFEQGANLPGGAFLIAAESLGVDVLYVLTGRSINDPPPGHLRIARVPQLGALESPSFVVFPDFVLRAKVGGIALDHLRWGLMPTAAMEPSIARNTAVAIDVSKTSRKDVVDGEVYAYTLAGRPDIRRIRIRKDHWTLAGPGRGGDSRDVYLSDLPALQILGAMIAVL